MSEDEVVHAHTIYVRTKHIADAYRHVQATGKIYVGLVFVGEDCIGVNTADTIDVPKIANEAPIAEMYQTRQHGPGGELLQTSQRRPERVGVKHLTDKKVMELIREFGPLNTMELGDRLNVARGDSSKRTRISRLLQGLSRRRMLKKEDSQARYPRYVLANGASRQVTGGKEAQAPQHKASRGGHSITPEAVLRVITERRHASTMEIGDALNIPRSESGIRGKITLTVRSLKAANKIRQATEFKDAKGFPTFEAVPASDSETQQDQASHSEA